MWSQSAETTRRSTVRRIIYMYLFLSPSKNNSWKLEGLSLSHSMTSLIIDYTAYSQPIGSLVCAMLMVTMILFRGILGEKLHSQQYCFCTIINVKKKTLSMILMNVSRVKLSILLCDKRITIPAFLFTQLFFLWIFCFFPVSLNQSLMRQVSFSYIKRVLFFWTS